MLTAQNHIQTDESEEASVQAQCENLLVQQPDQQFRRLPFMLACADMEYHAEARRWAANLKEGSTLRDMLDILPCEIRIHLLKLYIARRGYYEF